MKRNLFLYLLPDFLNQILQGYQLNGINKWCLQDKHIDKQISRFTFKITFIPLFEKLCLNFTSWRTEYPFLISALRFPGCVLICFPASFAFQFTLQFFSPCEVKPRCIYKELCFLSAFLPVCSTSGAELGELCAQKGYKDHRK